jgi:antitoxin YefM
VEVVNYSEFRKNLKEKLDMVCEDAEPLIVSRTKGKNVVVISLEEYNSWKETLYLLSSKNNRERLLESIEQAKHGETTEYTLDEIVGKPKKKTALIKKGKK